MNRNELTASLANIKALRELNNLAIDSVDYDESNSLEILLNCKIRKTALDLIAKWIKTEIEVLDILNK